MEACEPLGMGVVYDRPIAIGETGWGPIVSEMKARGVQYVTMVSSTTETIGLLTAMADQNFSPEVVDLGQQYYDQELAVTPGAEGTLVLTNSVPFEEAEDSPAMQTFLRWLGRITDDPPTTLGVQAFSAGMLFVEALSTLGDNISRERLLATLGTIHEWDGGGLHFPRPGLKQRRRCFLSAGHFRHLRAGVPRRRVRVRPVVGRRTPGRNYGARRHRRHTMSGPGTARRPRGHPADTPSDVTAASIVAAARREFTARGYAGASNRAIADAAGLTHTAIYNHFGSKAELFTAVFSDVHEILCAELQRAGDTAVTNGTRPLPDTLLDTIDALHARDSTYVDFLASMYVEVRRQPELQAVFQQGPRFGVVDVIRNLVGAHDPGTGDGTDAATWFWIVFAIGLAQVSTLTDRDTFATTVHAFRDRFTDLAGGGA